MNMEPLVKDYLLCHTFQQLEDEHGVCVRFSQDGTKASLNYDQILAKNGDPIAEQCRGMVIRPTQFDMLTFGDEWKNAVVGEIEILAWPMNRFYNHGDGAAAAVDWVDRGLRVYEKVDGTCIILYWDPLHGRWHAATRSVPEADQIIKDGDLEIGNTTFSQLFLMALIATREEISDQIIDWHVDGPDDVIQLNKELTYVFELVSPYNQIVVSYPKPRVYLLAVRNTKTGREIPIEDIQMQHVMRPKTWPIRDVHALAAFVDTASPSELEGAVVCDSSFRRLKVKNKSYVLAHRAKDNVVSSSRNMLEIIMLEKADDIIPLLPNDVIGKVMAMQAAYARYCKSIDHNVERFRAEAGTNRKRYAEQVMLSGDWIAPYFDMWEGRSQHAREWFKSASERGRLSSASLDTILGKLTM